METKKLEPVTKKGNYSDGVREREREEGMGKGDGNRERTERIEREDAADAEQKLSPSPSGFAAARRGAFHPPFEPRPTHHPRRRVPSPLSRHHETPYTNPRFHVAMYLQSEAETPLCLRDTAAGSRPSPFYPTFLAFAGSSFLFFRHSSVSLREDRRKRERETNTLDPMSKLFLRFLPLLRKGRETREDNSTRERRNEAEWTEEVLSVTV